MPRAARIKSKTGIYHVMLRGINRQDLFEDDADRQRFVETLETCQEKSRHTLFGYCLMSNHVHLLLRENNEPLAVTIKRLSSSYVYYFNWKYSRCGHLFQERFKSEAVDTDAYFLTVLRYIHQNPVKAKIVTDIIHYAWCSYRAYLQGSILINADFGLKMFSENHQQAIQAYIEFHKRITREQCLDLEHSLKISDDEAREIIKKYAKVKNMHEILRLEKGKRDELVTRLKSSEGLALRQIARITGLSYYLIQKL
ncbi:transposase [Dehalobacter sp. DCM]|uniref:transposase n=1 Tax=Dehalobacter sp. DCM TaxID=2907827 RepID=UPI0030812B7B|nr:transposase [Dehalobacter sp. DCM]